MTTIVWDDHKNTKQSATFTSYSDNIVAKGITFEVPNIAAGALLSTVLFLFALWNSLVKRVEKENIFRLFPEKIKVAHVSGCLYVCDQS